MRINYSHTSRCFICLLKCAWYHHTIAVFVYSSAIEVQGKYNVNDDICTTNQQVLETMPLENFCLWSKIEAYVVCLNDKSF